MPANRKISQLPEQTNLDASNSFLIIVDENGVNKKLRVSQIQIAGGGGGATVLQDLTNVSFTSLTDKNLLGYNAANSEWRNVDKVDAGYL